MPCVFGASVENSEKTEVDFLELLLREEAGMLTERCGAGIVRPSEERGLVRAFATEWPRCGSPSWGTSCSLSLVDALRVMAGRE